MSLSELRRKLDAKRTRTKLRYTYYDMKNGIKYFNTILPTEFMWMKQTLGWCAKSVDTLAGRLNFREFRNDGLNLNEIFLLNNPDILPDSTVLSALIASCSFIYISEDEKGLWHQAFPKQHLQGHIQYVRFHRRKRRHTPCYSWLERSTTRSSFTI